MFTEEKLVCCISCIENIVLILLSQSSLNTCSTFFARSCHSFTRFEEEKNLPFTISYMNKPFECQMSYLKNNLGSIELIVVSCIS